jgi:hypothetical protein
VKWLFIIPGVLVGFFIILSAPVLISIPFVLVSGWIPAAGRLAANAPFGAGDLALFGGGCLILVLGVHGFLRWLVQWRLRWSIALTSTAAGVLLSIMCAVGIAHQLGWILLSSEPVLVNRGGGWVREHIDLHNTAHARARIATDDLGTATNAGALLRDGRLPDTYDGKRPWEKYRTLWLGETGEHFMAVWPRDERIQGMLGTAVINRQGDVSFEQTNYTHAAKSY